MESTKFISKLCNCHIHVITIVQEEPGKEKKKMCIFQHAFIVKYLFMKIFCSATPNNSNECETVRSWIKMILFYAVNTCVAECVWIWSASGGYRFFYDAPVAEFTYMHLLVCQVRVTASDSGHCGCVHMTSFERSTFFSFLVLCQAHRCGAFNRITYIQYNNMYTHPFILQRLIV